MSGGSKSGAEAEARWVPGGRHTPLRDLAIQHLRALILSGELAPGVHLRENELAQSVGISKTPMREAILALARDGLVRTVPFRGNFVQKLDADQIRHIHDARVVIEMEAARHAAGRWEDADLARLKAQIAALVDAARNADFAAAAKEDIAFHSLIYEIANQPILLEMWELIKWRVRFVLLHDHKVRYLLHISQPQKRHQAILEAIRSRDPEVAAAAIATHIDWDELLRAPTANVSWPPDVMEDNEEDTL